VEQPLPPQFDFVFGKWAEEIKADPSVAAQQPYKAIIEKDPASFAGIANQDPEVVATLLKAFARSWAGSTPEEFEAQVRVWLTTVKQPKLGELYGDLVYRPMRELLDVLKAHDFRVFVVSGGGRDFTRVFAEETWGITHRHAHRFRNRIQACGWAKNRKTAISRAVNAGGAGQAPITTESSDAVAA
jgi:phosphoserine phosphatase